MDLQQQAQIVAGIRDKMKENIGTKVYIKVNLGRSRINENDATIIEAHPSVFVAKLEYKRGRTSEQSFQYADILTGVVEVLLDEKPMFGPFDIQPDAPLVDTSNRPKVKRRLRPVKPFEQRIRLSSEQVAMLAERLKKEAEDKKTNADRGSIISDLSRKYDIMKKAEKTKSTWDDADKGINGGDGDAGAGNGGAGGAGKGGAAASGKVAVSRAAVAKAVGDISSAVGDDVLKDMILTDEEKRVLKRGAAKKVNGKTASKGAGKGASATKGAGKSGSLAKGSGKSGSASQAAGAKRGRKKGSKNKVAGKKAVAAKQGTKATIKKAATKKATAKKAVAKSSAKKTADKKAVATSASKKSAAKKSAAKKSVDKKPVAKSSKNYTAAKKPVAKKSAAKRTTAKKSAAKKSNAKKATAKKPAVKKTTSNKTAAKKSRSKKPAKKANSAKKL